MLAYGSPKTTTNSPRAASGRGSGAFRPGPPQWKRPATRPLNGGSLCPDCGVARLARTICNAIGEVVGLGLHTPLKVELAHCERCDYAEFTGNWSIVRHEDGPAVGL